MNNNVKSFIESELLKNNFSKKENGDFYLEIDIDRNDIEIEKKDIKTIFESDAPMEKFIEIINEYFFCCLLDCEGEYYKIYSDIANDAKDYFGLSDDETEMLISEIQSMVYMSLPYDDILKQKVCSMVVLDAGDANYDFALNGAPYENGDDWSVDDLSDKSGMVWLTKQQGYSKEELFDALSSEEEYDKSEFLESMRVEYLNVSCGLTAIVFLLSMTLKECIELYELCKTSESDKKYLKISKDTCTGLYDFINGGGSILDIKLEKDVLIPLNNIWSAAPDGVVGYSLLNCYGAYDSLYDGTAIVQD